MKNLKWFFASAATMLLVASCSSEDPSINPIGGGNVNFRIQLPGGINTRSYGDGTSATTLHYAVYDKDGNLLSEPAAETFAEGELSKEISLDLVTGSTYQIAFFACNDASGVYSFSATNKNVSVDYTKVINADKEIAEDHDCFYKVETFEVTGPIDATVYLTRPMAQLNWGTDDAEKPIIESVYGKPAKVYANLEAKAYTTLDLLSGEASDEIDLNIPYPAAVGDELGNLTVGEKEFKYLHTLFLLVPKTESVVDTKLTAGPSADNQINTIPVSNVPLQRNYRTNIYGSLLTSQANITVVKDKNWGDENGYEIDLSKGGQVFVNAPQEQLDLTKAPETDLVVTLNAPVDKILLGSEDQNPASTTIVVAKDVKFPEFVFTPNTKTKGIRNLTIRGDLSSSERCTGFNAYGKITTIDGLTFVNVPFTDKGVKVSFTANPQTTRNITVKNCDFTELTEPAFSLQTNGYPGDNVGNIVVENNNIKFAADVPANQNGIYILSTTGGTISVKNNTVDGSSYHGIMLSNNKADLTVEGNSFTNFKEDGIKIDYPYGTINLLNNYMEVSPDQGEGIRVARFTVANGSPKLNIIGNSIKLNSMFTPAISIGYKAEAGSTVDLVVKDNETSGVEMSLVPLFDLKTVTPNAGSSDYANPFK